MKRKDPWWAPVLGILFALVILAAILGLVFVVRIHAPCWVFPLKEAPVRCLVVR